MKKIELVILLVLVFIIVSCSPLQETKIPSLVPTLNPSQNILDYFPLKENAYWVYRGTIKWVEFNSPDVMEDEITWKMEVKRVFTRNNIVGYELVGAPWDLAWYETGKEPSEYGIIQSGGKYYRIPVETVVRLMNEEDYLFGLIDESDVFLETPLASGKKFCEIELMARPDNMYCWNVGDAEPFEISNIKGINSSEVLWEYPIYNQTMPDVSIIYFVPGIGISHYIYHHNGTVSDVDVQLIEYYAGQ